MITNRLIGRRLAELAAVLEVGVGSFFADCEMERVG